MFLKDFFKDLVLTHTNELSINQPLKEKEVCPLLLLPVPPSRWYKNQRSY